MDLLREALPDPMFQQYLREATASVEEELALEDAGWINLSTGLGGGVQDATRIKAVKEARQDYYTDPLASQAIRLWTDYTFGKGMTWQTEDDTARKVLEGFWSAPENQAVLSARGQRMSSDKHLVDGDIFFAIFRADPSIIRRIDPLEITDFITDEGDVENVLFYKREWTDKSGKQQVLYYPSTTNSKAKSAAGETADALVYHLPFRTLGQRGTSLLYPGRFYLKYNKKFIASRISIMLALTRFAWVTKVDGGQAAVEAIKAKTEGKKIAAGSDITENMGVDTKPIRTDSGAANAYDDGRMIKLMFQSSVGISEQYFADISTGNLATAKTVELPMMKMFQSNQKVWADTYQDIFDVVLDHAGVSKEKWYTDIEFPAIAPPDVAQMGETLVNMLTAFPGFAQSPDVQAIAMQALGVNDPTKALEQLEEIAKELEKEEESDPGLAAGKALKRYRESLKEKENE